MSVVHQIVCFFKEKSIGVLKITYGHHPCIRKALSGSLKDDQIYFCQILSYREVWYTNLYVLCKINLMKESGRSSEVKKGSFWLLTLSHVYLRARWSHQPQSFSKGKVCSVTSYWYHLGFLISIQGVKNVFQSQEEFLTDGRSILFSFDKKRELWYTKL